MSQRTGICLELMIMGLLSRHTEKDNPSHSMILRCCRHDYILVQRRNKPRMSTTWRLRICLTEETAASHGPVKLDSWAAKAAARAHSWGAVSTRPKEAQEQGSYLVAQEWAPFGRARSLVRQGAPDLDPWGILHCRTSGGQVLLLAPVSMRTKQAGRAWLLQRSWRGLCGAI
ncbi:uncharacterized protein B0I36DRAFT_430586 [Microdochium trichocladiopsis]|uniref:Uncharacterized protein n=1 Tax=Microdochium trichocladiopsis TaxID=1682393 RepID=A0A9P8Y926_9PEZI|nr:uncharacterized protein B0I36DRAFT_430586 [Microdochium trichocladiopsis]KAH7033347.1 hypothetical protein B0I36DRAFT_430586 [Microdochium trichocladiopsis]